MWPFANSADTWLWEVSRNSYALYMLKGIISDGSILCFFKGDAEYDALTEDKIVTEIRNVVGDAKNLDDDIIHLFSSNHNSN